MERNRAGTVNWNERSVMMGWTAPAFRHRSAIRWLSVEITKERSRPTCRLAPLVWIWRSAFFRFTGLIRLGT